MPHTIYLIRHGENPANIKHELSHKQVDYGLNAKGQLQAEQTAAFFKDRKLDALWSSPLKRAVETAEYITRATGLPLRIDERFRALNVGDLDGDQTLESWKLHDDIVQDWFNNAPERRFPNGENYTEFLGRFAAGLRMLVEPFEHDAHIALVGHGCLIGFCMRSIASNFDPMILKTKRGSNCSITTITIDPTPESLNGVLVEWADASHLSGTAAEFVSATPTDKWKDLESMLNDESD